MVMSHLAGRADLDPDVTADLRNGPPRLMSDPAGSSEATRSAEHDDDFSHLDPVLVEFARTPGDDPRPQQLRDRLAAGFLPLARHLARRFARRGVADDDLFQVASVGLGEIRRYFRDNTWSMRVPRRLKDLHSAVTQAVSALTADLGRAPRPSEIAARPNISTDEVLESLEAAQAYASQSLDQSLAAQQGEGATRGDLLGALDAQLEQVEERETLRPLLAELPERERTILLLRFFGNQTQSQIAQHVGLSQMHVSRLLSTTLEKLHSQMVEG
jgi:RNA polymerase sigma-B factor